MDLSSYSVAMVHLGDGVRTLKFEVPTKYRKGRAYVASTLHDQAKWFLDEVGPAAVFIEEPVVAGARNLRSSLLIAQVCGAVLVAAGMERVVRLTPVSSWKKETVGNGNAGKQDVRDWLDAAHPQVAAVCGHDQDLYDATCVALHGQGLLRRSDVLRSGLHDEPRLPGLAP